jgi:hypothetical protein
MLIGIRPGARTEEGLSCGVSSVLFFLRRGELEGMTEAPAKTQRGPTRLPPIFLHFNFLQLQLDLSRFLVARFLFDLDRLILLSWVSPHNKALFFVHPIACATFVLQRGCLPCTSSSTSNLTILCLPTLAYFLLTLDANWIFRPIRKPVLEPTTVLPGRSHAIRSRSICCLVAESLSTWELNTPIRHVAGLSGTED